MTLCVGIEKKGKLWIGADSGISDGEGLCASSLEPKIWKIGDWILASAGVWRAIAVVRLAANFPKVPDNSNDAYKIITIDIVSEIEKVLENNYFDYDLDKENKKDRNDWLIGSKNIGLYHIDQDYHVTRETECAIGSPNYAAGFLDGSSISDPELRIKECIKGAAKRFPGSVRLPITILSSE